MLKKLVYLQQYKKVTIRGDIKSPLFILKNNARESRTTTE